VRPALEPVPVSPVLICRFVVIANAIENQFVKMVKATRQELTPCRMVQWFA
jgi:hypothetical protein